MQMNYQNNSRDFFFHLLLQYSARGRTGSDPSMLLVLRPRCRSSRKVAEQKSQETSLTCREGQWTNPGGNAGGAAAALRATEWHWHTGTELPAAAALPRQCHLGSPAQGWMWARDSHCHSPKAQMTSWGCVPLYSHQKRSPLPSKFSELQIQSFQTHSLTHSYRNLFF